MQIIPFVFFFFVIPLIVMGALLSGVKILVIGFFIFLTVLVIVFKTFTVYVYSDKLCKSFVFRDKVEMFSSEKIHFKFGHHRAYFLIPNVVAYNKGKVISHIEFSSFSSLEHFVLKTKKNGYSWSNPSGTGDVFDEIRYIIQNK